MITPDIKVEMLDASLKRSEGQSNYNANRKFEIIEMIDFTIAGFIFKTKHIQSQEIKALRVISMDKWGQY